MDESGNKRREERRENKGEGDKMRKLCQRSIMSEASYFIVRERRREREREA